MEYAVMFIVYLFFAFMFGCGCGKKARAIKDGEGEDRVETVILWIEMIGSGVGALIFGFLAWVFGMLFQQHISGGF